MRVNLKKEFGFGKVGIDEVVGLKDILKDLIIPVVDRLKQDVYWDDLILYESEYKVRDGFIPYSHNCGGVEIGLMIPECESYEFPYLEFGECENEECNTETHEYCSCDDENHLSAHLRIWFKFEGINEVGDMEFYLVMSGGNNDAPYFRENYQPILFEKSFNASTLKQVRSKGIKAIKELIKSMK
mgnify:CR=1 FL=1